MTDDQLIICRCEEITRGEIIEAIRKGARTPAAVKRLTRAGMGLCQGRTCRRLIAQIIAQETQRDVGDIMPGSYRFPTRPLAVKDLKGESE